MVSTGVRVNPHSLLSTLQRLRRVVELTEDRLITFPSTALFLRLIQLFPKEQQSLHLSERLLEHLLMELNHRSLIRDSLDQLSTQRPGLMIQEPVYSVENENTFLTSLPNNKSFTFNMQLETGSTFLSPAIDLSSSSAIFIHNRTNAPISDYATDFRVNTTEDDPNSFFYVTKLINLENPGTSIQVLFDTYISQVNDVRVLFATGQRVPVDQTVFIPFPGYGNIGPNGEVLNNT